MIDKRKAGGSTGSGGLRSPTRRRLLFGGIAGMLGLGALGTGLFSRAANAYYQGPVSDHFDGVTFFNPGGREPRGLASVARLYVGESWSRWPEHRPLPAREVPPREVAGPAARVTFIGHASWLVQTGGRNVLVDPVWSERASPFSFAGPRRADPPGVAFDDLPPIHAVLVTHNHYDHLDLATLARLSQRDRPVIVTPLGNDAIMRAAIGDLEVHAVDWGQTTALGNGLVVHTEPCQHWSARGARDRSHALWASFVMETPAGKIHAVGDSGLGDGRTFRHVAARHPDLKLALLPIGAYEPRWFMESQHMNPADAVTAFRLLGAKQALGHHWGTFQLTTEARDRPAADLARALEAAGIDGDRFRAVRPGDVTILHAEA